MDSTSTVHPSRTSIGREHHGTSPAQRAAQDRDITRDAMLKIYEPIVGHLGRVEKRLGSELRSRHNALSPILSHGTQLGGKRLRPAMLLLAGAAVGPLNEDHVVLGTVIEMVHTATLVHDDVLDQAATRRHTETINARWDTDTSILLGDYLFAQSFRLAATLSSTEACRMIGEAARLVCEGELRQVLSRDAIGMDEVTYIEVIRGKTAELCRVACRLGAMLSDGDPKVIDAMGTYGDAVGVAFQIADDYLDLWGDDETVGKTLGTDIGQGKMTLPLIHLMQSASAADRRDLRDILRGPAESRLRRIRPYLRTGDARRYTREVAQRFKRQAVDALSVLPESAAKTSLSAIADFSIDRRF